MHISEALKGKVVGTIAEKGQPRNARQAVLQEALDKINPGRIQGGYKPLTIPGLEARYTGGMSLFDVQWHVRECLKTDSFSKCFFGRLKMKKK